MADANEGAGRDLSTLVDARDELQSLVRTIWHLRQPDGCPWDRKQTHASIAKNMIEEAYEAVDCIEDDDVAHLREELGDVLMQVVLHAQIAADAGEFTMADVAHDIDEKLIRRHPHVFGEHAAANDADEVLDIWDQVKLAEKEARDADAAAAEERAEFEQEKPGSDAREMEFGDLLFALVNVARKEGIDAESALRASTAKFRARWAAMEDVAFGRGIALESLSTAELNELWDDIKH